MPAAIFSGANVKILKSILDLNGQAQILSGTVDPSSSATSAPAGSLYLNTSNGYLYRKRDAGSSTNWSRISEYLSATFGSDTTAWPISAATYGDLTSLAVPAGDWALSFHASSANSGGAITTTEIRLGISTSSGNASAGMLNGINSVNDITVATGQYRRYAMANFIISPSSLQNYYLKGKAETSISNLTIACRLTALRIS